MLNDVAKIKAIFINKYKIILAIFFLGVVCTYGVLSFVPQEYEARQSFLVKGNNGMEGVLSVYSTGANQSINNVMGLSEEPEWYISKAKIRRLLPGSFKFDNKLTNSNLKSQSDSNIKNLIEDNSISLEIIARGHSREEAEQVGREFGKLFRESVSEYNKRIEMKLYEEDRRLKAYRELFLNSRDGEKEIALIEYQAVFRQTDEKKQKTEMLKVVLIEETEMVISTEPVFPKKNTGYVLSVLMGTIVVSSYIFFKLL